MSCPRLQNCRLNCEHRRFVLDYYAERERQEIAAENDYRNRDGNENAAPIVTFKAWLIATRTYQRRAA